MGEMTRKERLQDMRETERVEPAGKQGASRERAEARGGAEGEAGGFPSRERAEEELEREGL